MTIYLLEEAKIERYYCPKYHTTVLTRGRMGGLVLVWSAESELFVFTWSVLFMQRTASGDPISVFSLLIQQSTVKHTNVLPSILANIEHITVYSELKICSAALRILVIWVYTTYNPWFPTLVLQQRKIWPLVHCVMYEVTRVQVIRAKIT